MRIHLRHLLHVGVTTFSSETVLGRSPFTGVPPELSVMIAPPTVMNVVAVGIATTTVLPPPTKVSDGAPVDG
jgi:hypothetical protein